MREFLFNQPNALEKLTYVRISLCCVIIILLTLGPYDSFYVDTSSWLFQAKTPFHWFPNLGIYFWTIKYTVILLAICSAFNYQRWLTAPLLAVTFLFFNFYITCFGTTYWITNTHLNFFALALCFEPLSNHSKHKERASYILAFMITYIAVLYFQAGLSKLIYGGWQWFLGGERIRIETMLIGTYFGKWLLQWPPIFHFLGIVTGIVELIIPFFFFMTKTRKWAALCAIAFHLGTFFSMGISFWFLWALFPAIFFEKQKRYKESLVT